MYLYSFKENKILSQGFDKIEAKETIEEKEVDYVKDYGCLKATCFVSSNIVTEQKENSTNELVGKLSLKGGLMECIFNMNTVTTYSYMNLIL